jgi:hypothetical protein
MSMMHVLEGDGIQPHLFYALAKEKKRDLSSCPILVAPTVLFEQGFAKAVFSSEAVRLLGAAAEGEEDAAASLAPSRKASSPLPAVSERPTTATLASIDDAISEAVSKGHTLPAGYRFEVKRKMGREISLREVYEDFCAGTAEGDIVAVLMECLPRSADFSQTSYLSQTQLHRYLFEQVEKPRAMLQKFIRPQGLNNVTIHAVWTPLVLIAEGRRSVHSLHDRHLSIELRAQTYETHDPRRCADVLLSKAVADGVGRACQAMREHIEATERGMQLSRLACYFKIDQFGRLVFLCPLSVRFHAPKDPRPGEPMVLSGGFKPAGVVDRAESVAAETRRLEDLAAREARIGPVTGSAVGNGDTTTMLQRSIHESVRDIRREQDTAFWNDVMHRPSGTAPPVFRAPTMETAASIARATSEEVRPFQFRALSSASTRPNTRASGSAAARSEPQSLLPVQQSPSASIGAAGRGRPMSTQPKLHAATTTTRPGSRNAAPAAAALFPPQRAVVHDALNNAQRPKSGAGAALGTAAFERQVQHAWETHVARQRRDAEALGGAKATPGHAPTAPQAAAMEPATRLPPLAMVEANGPPVPRMGSIDVEYDLHLGRAVSRHRDVPATGARVGTPSPAPSPATAAPTGTSSAGEIQSGVASIAADKEAYLRRVRDGGEFPRTSNLPDMNAAALGPVTSPFGATAVVPPATPEAVRRDVVLPAVFAPTLSNAARLAAGAAASSPPAGSPGRELSPTVDRSAPSLRPAVSPSRAAGHSAQVAVSPNRLTRPTAVAAQVALPIARQSPAVSPGASTKRHRPGDRASPHQNVTGMSAARAVKVMSPLPVAAMLSSLEAPVLEAAAQEEGDVMGDVPSGLFYEQATRGAAVPERVLAAAWEALDDDQREDVEDSCTRLRRFIEEVIYTVYCGLTEQRTGAPGVYVEVPPEFEGIMDGATLARMLGALHPQVASRMQVLRDLYVSMNRDALPAAVVAGDEPLPLVVLHRLHESLITDLHKAALCAFAPWRFDAPEAAATYAPATERDARGSSVSSSSSDVDDDRVATSARLGFAARQAELVVVFPAFPGTILLAANAAVRNYGPVLDAYLNTETGALRLAAALCAARSREEGRDADGLRAAHRSRRRASTAGAALNAPADAVMVAATSIASAPVASASPQPNFAFGPRDAGASKASLLMGSPSTAVPVANSADHQLDRSLRPRVSLEFCARCQSSMPLCACHLIGSELVAKHAHARSRR